MRRFINAKIYLQLQHGKVQLVNDPIWLSDAKSLIAKYNTEINSLSLLNITLLNVLNLLQIRILLTIMFLTLI